MKINIFDYNEITPFADFGLTGKFWSIHIDTLIYTWAGMFLLLLFVLLARLFMKRKMNAVSWLVEQVIGFFVDLCKESFGGNFKHEYFAFVSTIFFFTLFSCLVGLLPFLEESTKDLNTTFALGLISFLYVHYQKIKHNGIVKYLKEFTEPFIVLLPLNLVGELAKIASMSFRLFGNILGGSIIFLIVLQVVGAYKIWFMALSFITLIATFIVNKTIKLEDHKWLKITLYSMLGVVFFLASMQMFFGVFEGIIQAFVITMLTITYLAVGVGDENEEGTVLGE